LAKLCSAFQTEEKLYYMMEYYPGGELFCAIERGYPEGLPEGTTLLYCAEVLCGLSVLHSLQVLHRDVRLENILLDATGHARLCDYGLGILLTDASGTGIPFVRRRTTEVYSGANEIFQSPETSSEAGYGAGLDFWQLGIMTFVMCTGEFPPSVGMERRSTLIEEKLQAKSTSPALQSMILQLLEENQDYRLGYDGASDVSKHTAFQSLDWNSVMAHEDNDYLLDVTGHNRKDGGQRAHDSMPTNWEQDVLSFADFTFRGSALSRGTMATGLTTSESNPSDGNSSDRRLMASRLMRFSTFDSSDGMEGNATANSPEHTDHPRESSKVAFNAHCPMSISEKPEDDFEQALNHRSRSRPKKDIDSAEEMDSDDNANDVDLSRFAERMTAYGTNQLT